MKNNILLKTFIVITLFIFVITINSMVLANSTFLKKSDKEYLIYLEGLLDKTFEFAFSNTSLDNDASLNYISNGQDAQNGNNIAYINENIYNQFFDGKKDTYFWVKSNGKYILKNQKLYLGNPITEDVLQVVKNTTKRISVDTTKQNVTTEERDGIKYTTTVGMVLITDDNHAEYFYNIVKLPATEDYANLLSLVNKINGSLDIITNLNSNVEFSNLYNKLISEITDEKWTKVEDMKILQPKDSKTGEQYVLWIQKNIDGIKTYDMQILTSYQNVEQQFTTEQQVVKETTKLPTTYDSIALFVILGIAIVALIILVVVKKKGNRNEK